MSGFQSDYEHVWKGIVQTIMMLIVLGLCIFGSIEMIKCMIAGTVSLWLIPVLVLMLFVVVLFSYGIVNMWKMYFEWKKNKEKE